eukprot:7696873-Pyramimonas_sp.AAC.1
MRLANLTRSCPCLLIRPPANLGAQPGATLRRYGHRLGRGTHKGQGVVGKPVWKPIEGNLLGALLRCDVEVQGAPSP